MAERCVNGSRYVSNTSKPARRNESPFALAIISRSRIGIHHRSLSTSFSYLINGLYHRRVTHSSETDSLEASTWSCCHVAFCAVRSRVVTKSRKSCLTIFIPFFHAHGGNFLSVVPSNLFRILSKRQWDRMMKPPLFPVPLWTEIYPKWCGTLFTST